MKERGAAGRAREKKEKEYHKFVFTFPPSVRPVDIPLHRARHIHCPRLLYICSVGSREGTARAVR